MKQLGQQSVNVDTLTPNDLNQLSEVITQALQEVDDGEGVKGRQLDDESDVKREPGPQGTLGVEIIPEGTFVLIV